MFESGIKQHHKGLEFDCRVRLLFKVASCCLKTCERLVDCNFLGLHIIRVLVFHSGSRIHIPLCRAFLRTGRLRSNYGFQNLLVGDWGAVREGRSAATYCSAITRSPVGISRLLRSVTSSSMSFLLWCFGVASAEISAAAVATSMPASPAVAIGFCRNTSKLSQGTG